MNVPARRAIEALRSGVPNADAVRELGSNHQQALAAFEHLLTDIEGSYTTGQGARGVLVAGGFGTGKSHLLTHLMHRALDARFAVSPIAISKETILGDPGKVFATAVSELRVPGRAGTGLRNVADGLDSKRQAYGSFFQWVDPSVSGLPSQFAASLYIHQHGQDLPFNDEIVRFWGGGRITMRDLRQRLQAFGQAATYPLTTLPPARELHMHRFRFVSRLIAAAGMKGWLILIDEAELIGSYTLRQRAKAYAEIARWLGCLSPQESVPGVGAVVAITDDFTAAIIEGRNDLEMIPGRLQASARPEDQALSERALAGMNVIGREAMRLEHLTPGMIGDTRDCLLHLYRNAYGLDEAWPPGGPGSLPAPHGSDVMRLFVRQWIAEWDLRRLFPGYAPRITVTPFTPGALTEDEDLTRDEPDE